MGDEAWYSSALQNGKVGERKELTDVLKLLVSIIDARWGIAYPTIAIEVLLPIP